VRKLCLLGLLLDSEEGGSTFLRNVGVGLYGVTSQKSITIRFTSTITEHAIVSKACAELSYCLSETSFRVHHK
jgi:glucose-6-phosphate dehydrogenase assembly protein OpcA